MLSKAKLLALAFVVALLLACGGGGGNSVISTSNPLALIFDAVGTVSLIAAGM